MTTPIKPETLKLLCGLNGLTVAELAKRVKRSRTSVYLAAENPKRYPAAFAAMEKQLKNRDLPSEEPKPDRKTSRARVEQPA